MAFDVPDFARLLALESHGPDVHVGISPTYPWGGLYGGQVVAQGLRAAALSLDDERPVHSLHAYFIRTGNVDEPVRYEVDRIRSGRTFPTRRVVARQSVGAILNMSASFQTSEEGASTSALTAPTGIARPEELATDGWGDVLDRRTIRMGAPGQTTLAWLRTKSPRGEGPALAECALAYTSDDLPTAAVSTAHPRQTSSEQEWDATFFSVSLDHTIWFHRPFSPDAWLLQETTSHGVHGGRGLALANIFDEEGQHVATVAQEVLLRERR